MTIDKLMWHTYMWVCVCVTTDIGTVGWRHHQCQVTRVRLDLILVSGGDWLTPVDDGVGVAARPIVMCATLNLLDEDTAAVARLRPVSALRPVSVTIQHSLNTAPKC